MTVSSISGSDWTNHSTKETNSTDEQLADFFTLLLAQMQNQDPLEPMSNEEMMSQFAQLTTVQELKNLTSAVEDMTTAGALSDSTSLIGKTVIATDDNDNTIQGVVEMVYISDEGKVTLSVDGEEVSLDFIDVVYDGTDTLTTTLEQLAASSSLSYASSLIGKYIEADTSSEETTDETESTESEEEEEETEDTIISGTVASVEVTDEGVVLVLTDEQEVLLSDVIRVADTAPAEEETTEEESSE